MTEVRPQLVATNVQARYVAKSVDDTTGYGRTEDDLEFYHHSHCASIVTDQ